MYWTPTILNGVQLYFGSRIYGCGIKISSLTSSYGGIKIFNKVGRASNSWKIGGVKNEVKKWNREVFGDVRLEKNTLLNRIGELDEMEIIGELDENRRVERRKLEETILREQISWNQKVKIKGVTEWDNNSKLFHRAASRRKANKVINKIEGSEGSVLYSEREIVEEITSFFEGLYNENEKINFRIEGLEWEGISRAIKEKLKRPFEEEKIKKALFHCEGDKARGPDGFSMAALQEG